MANEKIKLIEGKFAVTNESIIFNIEDISYCELITSNYEFPSFESHEVDWIKIHLKNGLELVLNNGKRIYKKIQSFSYQIL